MSYCSWDKCNKLSRRERHSFLQTKVKKLPLLRRTRARQVILAEKVQNNPTGLHKRVNACAGSAITLD
jgi:hypothetical protein